MAACDYARSLINMRLLKRLCEERNMNMCLVYDIKESFLESVIWFSVFLFWLYYWNFKCMHIQIMTRLIWNWSMLITFEIWVCVCVAGDWLFGWSVSLLSYLWLSVSQQQHHIVISILKSIFVTIKMNMWNTMWLLGDLSINM